MSPGPMVRRWRALRVLVLMWGVVGFVVGILFFGIFTLNPLLILLGIIGFTALFVIAP